MKYLASDYTVLNIHEVHKVNKLADNLFWRIRKTMFAMDKRGESFPTPVAERVLKYAPVTLFKHPKVLAKIVYNLLSVVVEGVDFKDCTEAIDNELKYYNTALNSY